MSADFWSKLGLVDLLAIAGVAGALLSAVSSLLNHIVRQKQLRKEPVSDLLLGCGVFVNALSVNFDKSLVMAKALRGLPLESGTAVQTAAPELSAAKCEKCGQPIPVSS